MPKISIDHDSKLKAPEALKLIKTFFENDKDLQKFDAKMTSKFDDASMSGKVQGSQFKADVHVKAQDPGSKVSVIIDLPLLLSPFKGKIEETIKKKLTRFL